MTDPRHIAIVHIAFCGRSDIIHLRSYWAACHSLGPVDGKPVGQGWALAEERRH